MKKKLPNDATTRRLMWTSLAFTTLPVLMPTLHPSFTAEVVARTVVSMWLYGGLLMLIALVRGAWRMTARDVTVATQTNALAS